MLLCRPEAIGWLVGDIFLAEQLFWCMGTACIPRLQHHVTHDSEEREGAPLYMPLDFNSSDSVQICFLYAEDDLLDFTSWSLTTWRYA